MRTIKKKCLFLMLVSIVLVGMLCGVAGAGANDSGLVAYWPFNEGSGDTAYDVVGANHGTIVGDTTWTDNSAPVPGNNYALSLNGSTYVDIGDVLDFDQDDPFSLHAWVKRARTGNIEAIVTKMHATDPYRGYLLWFHHTDKIMFIFRHTNSPIDAIWVETTNMFTSTDTWYHVVTTYDGSGDAEGVNIYVNGVTQSLTITRDNLGNETINDAPLNIGGRDNGNQLFQGIIDEVAIFDKALTSAEVVDLKENGVASLLSPEFAVQWLPPLTNMEEFVLQDGTTLPLKFQLLDEDGNVVEDLQEGIYLEIDDVETWELGDGRDALRFEDGQYIANFHTRDYDLVDEAVYTVTVYDADDNMLLMSISFELSTDKGVGRGRGPQR